MGEKLYRPKLKSDEHLLHSKDNPKNVRGISRDANNKHPDIPEWEEVDVDDLDSQSYETGPGQAQPRQEESAHLTPEQEEMARILGEALAQVIITEGNLLFHNVIAPWWKNKAWPLIKKQGSRFKRRRVSKKTSKTTEAVSVQKINQRRQTSQPVEQVLLQMDDAFEMSPEEARQHVMQMYYHLLGLANEIQIISKTRIHQESNADEATLQQRQQELEQVLVAQLSSSLDNLLADQSLHLDIETSREIYAATGGGIRIEGDYIPVQPDRIGESLKKISNEDYHVQ